MYRTREFRVSPSRSVLHHPLAALSYRHSPNAGYSSWRNGPIHPRPKSSRFMILSQTTYPSSFPTRRSSTLLLPFISTEPHNAFTPLLNPPQSSTSLRPNHSLINPALTHSGVYSLTSYANIHQWCTPYHHTFISISPV